MTRHGANQWSASTPYDLYDKTAGVTAIFTVMPRTIGILLHIQMIMSMSELQCNLQIQASRHDVIQLALGHICALPSAGAAAACPRGLG